MKVVVHQEKVFALIDVLLARWKAKEHPYNRKDAVVPQTVIPEELRRDQHLLACFYFYVCIYMRGGIESLQAFNALIKMWRAHPDLFQPSYAATMDTALVQTILKRFIGWDSKEASRNWVENSQRLVRNWGGHPLNLIKNLKSYDEALRRIKNKLTKKEKRDAGWFNEGFRGFQPKMVSMLLYFYDWEGWLSFRFLYPAPADFHNFRLGLSQEAIVVTMNEGQTPRAAEQLSAPWREAVMAYLKARGADPIEVSDAIWLFSLLMCGNSPATVTKTLPDAPLLAHHKVKENWNHGEWLSHRGRKKLEQTCLVCPFLKTCRYAIPANPYYRRGQLILRVRPRFEDELHMRAVLQSSEVTEASTEERPLLFALDTR